MTLSLLALGMALAAPPQSFPMNDAGITLNLAPSWEMTRWSDWDFKAKTRDGVQVKVWTTPFQVEVTEEAVQAWAGMYAAEMEGEGFAEVKVVSAKVTTVAGRPTGSVKLSMQPRSGGPMKAVLNAMSFTGNAQVIHAYSIALARLDDKAERALMELASGLEVTKKPVEIKDGAVSTAAGFGATLPPGWRAPLPEELTATIAVTSKAGEEELDPAKCWVAIRPPPVGEPDVIYACTAALYLGPVDEHSFAGVEPEVREKFFGRVDPPVPAAESVAVGDRTGFYFRPGGGEKPIRLAVAPYGAGQVMMMWGLARNLDAAGLDAAMQQVLPKVTFSGENGGQPIIGLDRKVGYYLKYRTFSPIVMGPALLLLAFVGLVVRALGKKPTPAV